MMKRVSAILLSLALSASLCLPTLAAGVTVDGKTVSDAEAVTMVPLRSVSEALGWTVTWDGSLPGARVETGQVHIDLTLGKDTYQTVSSTAIGMSAPFSLGAAPTMLEPGTIYVPAELFQVLLGNREGTVSIGDDGSVSISQSGGTQVISPLHQHETLAELRSAVGFDFPVPNAPAGFQVTCYQDIAGTMAEVRWSDDVQEICYRVSRGGDGTSSDNSGDYTVYAESGTLDAGGTTVHWRGQDGRIRVAVWTGNNLIFSIRAAEGLTQTQVAQMVQRTL